MNRLGKSIFKRQGLKLRQFNSCVVPIFTYGSESRTVTKHMDNRLDACENHWFRRIMWIAYVHRIAN